MSGLKLEMVDDRIPGAAPVSAHSRFAALRVRPHAGANRIDARLMVPEAKA